MIHDIAHVVHDVALSMDPRSLEGFFHMYFDVSIIRVATLGLTITNYDRNL